MVSLIGGVPRPEAIDTCSGNILEAMGDMLTELEGSRYIDPADIEVTRKNMEKIRLALGLIEHELSIHTDDANYGAQ